MICKRCFRMSDDDLNYCPYCGKSFTDDSEIDVTKNNEGKDETADKDNSAYKTGGTPVREPINMFREGHTPPYTPYYTPPAEKSFFSKVCSSLSHAVLYVLLFLVMQTVVATAFSTVVMMNVTADYMNKYYVDNGIDYSKLTNEEYEALISRLYDELNVVMLDSVNEIDLNAVSAVSAAATVLVLLIIAKVKKRTFADHVGLHLSPLKKWHLWLVIPAGIAVQYIIIFLLNVIPFSEEMLQSYEELYAYMGTSALWLEVLAVVIGAPVVEELIFRGCVYSRLRRALRPLPSALISAFFFGIAHGHIIAVTYAFILGLILSYLYEKYDTVAAPILFHAAFNASNYIPLIRDDSSPAEILITFGAAMLIAAVCAVIIHTKSAVKTIDKEVNDKTEGI